MGTHTGNVITLANSIIGVSILAMPYCFKQCGIVLSVLMLLFSNIISRLSCHYLMKSAIMEKRKNFEMLAFRAYGPTGKLLAELCIIGFMLGTCIAYFVIMGDLGPGIVGPTLGFQHPAALRPSVLIAIAIFVVLPLGLLKNVDSLSGVCAATVAFYGCLVLKVIGEAIQHLLTSDWTDKVYYWKPAGILQVIPIFSMALSCQTQLFEIFDSLPSTPLDRMNSVVKSATNMVTLIYISVGFFGYVAYCDQTFSGNLMMNFSKTMTSEVIKIGFLMSVAVSFPLVIFPCRASIHSLFFSKGYEHAQTGSAHIPESRFQCITLVIVTISLVTGLLIPNIEVVLGLVGSTIGVIICVIVPAIIFVSISTRNNNERLVAKGLVFIGMVIMVLGTYANLYATEEAISKPVLNPAPIIKEPIPNSVLQKVEIKDNALKNLKNIGDLTAALPKLKTDQKIKAAQEVISKEIIKEGIVRNIENPTKDVKREPPVPEEPVVIKKVDTPKLPIANLPKDSPKVDLLPKVETVPVVDPLLKEEIRNKAGIIAEPIKNVLEDIKVEQRGQVIEKKEDEETLKHKEKEIKKEILIEKIKEHQEAQVKLLAEGEQLINELKKTVKEDIGTNASNDFVANPKSVINPVPVEVLKEAKTEEKIAQPEKPKVIEEGRLVASMAKGLPLPLAVKGNLGTIVKESDKSKLENEVVEKVGRDILGGEIKELREKRDLEGLPTESSIGIGGKAPGDKVIPPELPKADANKETILVEPKKKLIVEDINSVDGRTCVKNVSSEKTDGKEEKLKLIPINSDTNQTGKGLMEKKPVDNLIKFSSHLSDPKPILNESPLLIENKPDFVIAGMPQKRDLKSIETDELSEPNQTNS